MLNSLSAHQGGLVVTVLILVVEDDAPLATLLGHHLEASGYRVEFSARGDDAELRLRERPLPNLVILDWMLPEVSGIELCRRLRARRETQTLPIVMLSARGTEADLIRGLSIGADDYVAKPFSVPVLLARIQAVLRRACPQTIANTLTLDDIKLERSTRRVHRAGTEIQLSPTEFRLLDFLMANPGRVFSRQELLDQVWGLDADLGEYTVNTCIRRLRRRLNAGHVFDPIRAVYSAGYVMRTNRS